MEQPVVPGERVEFATRLGGGRRTGRRGGLWLRV